MTHFIALTCTSICDKPFTIHVKADAITVLVRDEPNGGSLFSLPGDTPPYRVSETPEEVLAMIAEATGRTADIDMAKLLVAVWTPTRTGYLHINEVAEYLRRSPADVKQTYVRAQQLAEGQK